ncbi:Homeobox protein ceh-20 [Aphelenchoides fujianensis]|nr:Homeobox protein ceh-20 [Aphelenchoides fujianensis]
MPIKSDENLQPVDGLLDELDGISEEFYTDDSTDTATKRRLLDHPFKAALFSELCALKRRRGAQPLRALANDEEYDAQVMRLDNMLLAEEVVAADGSTPAMAPNFMADQPEYRQKLIEIRETYAQSMSKYVAEAVEFTEHINTLLQHQQQARPITQQEVQRMLEIVRKKLTRFQIHLKQTTCENLVNLRHRFLDARRRRRNHTREATEILNRYFQEHIHNPYPSEDDKAELARLCKININQISNWFGNRRIRYKKSLIKQQQQQANHTPPPPPPPPPAVGLPLVNPYAAAAMMPDLYGYQRF